MTDQELIKKKYNRFNPSNLDGQYVTDLYQKSFTDQNNNRKYFLIWKKYDFSKYADRFHKDLNKPRYEGDTQLTFNENNQVINLTFLDGWSTNDAEKFLEKLFATGWFKKYDDLY